MFDAVSVIRCLCLNELFCDGLCHCCVELFI